MGAAVAASSEYRTAAGAFARLADVEVIDKKRIATMAKLADKRASSLREYNATPPVSLLHIRLHRVATSPVVDLVSASRGVDIRGVAPLLKACAQNVEAHLLPTMSARLRGRLQEYLDQVKLVSTSEERQRGAARAGADLERPLDAQTCASLLINCVNFCDTG
jgi:hypothetical protein